MPGCGGALPTAEASIQLTSSFFAATLAALAGGGCSIMWELGVARVNVLPPSPVTFGDA